MMWAHIFILSGIGFFCFMAGRLKRIMSYEDKIRAVETDKEYWRAIASRQSPPPEPPDL